MSNEYVKRVFGCSQEYDCKSVSQGCLDIRKNTIDKVCHKNVCQQDYISSILKLEISPI